ncbi:MAG: winged helix-turn-helix transcriptional regulator [Candidatus Nanohaloarchaea archaeon]
MSGNRELVEETVRENPGIGFNDLKRETGLSNGVLQYHTENSSNVQKRKGGIIPAGKCRDCCFSSDCHERCLLNVLRDERCRKILELKSRGLKHREIAEELGVDDSTVSYHVERLREFRALDEDDVPVLETV